MIAEHREHTFRTMAVSVCQDLQRLTEGRLAEVGRLGLGTCPIQTVQKRLAVIQAARLELNPTDADALQRANRLTSEQEELNERLKSLTEQRTLLKNQQDALLLKSPIAGEVLTWDLQEKLLARPVQRGQRLLTVAHLAGRAVDDLGRCAEIDAH